MNSRWHQLLTYFALFLAPLFVAIKTLNHRISAPHPMSSRADPDEIASSLLAIKGLRLQSSKPIQSLWAGYGQIARIIAISDAKAEPQSYILKLVTPPPTKANDEGHVRKMLSYEVEQYFYTVLAPQMPASIPVATCLGSINQRSPDGACFIAMILNDLRQNYPVAGEKREALSSIQAHAALKWLSDFHGFWWPRVEDIDRSPLVLPPLQELQHSRDNAAGRSVWLNGGYTYLATRRKEFEILANNHGDEWSLALTQPIGSQNMSIAEMVATFLAPRPSEETPIQDYQTLLHGDVKSENLFSSTSGEEVAFYDFQYVGLGLGVCDLAKLFTCSIRLDMLVDEVTLPSELQMQQGEEQLLRTYWKRLVKRSGRKYDWQLFNRHWETALVDWLRFQASWGFWGNTEWLEARVRSIVKDAEWRQFLRQSLETKEK